MNISTHDKSKWGGPKKDAEQPSSNPFRVGETYANRQGKYEVMEITPPTMTVRYENGGLMVADIAILARIWDNVQSELELPEPKPRSLPAGKPAIQPRATRRPRSSGRNRT